MGVARQEKSVSETRIQKPYRVRLLKASGKNGAGAIVLPGAQLNEVVVGIWGYTTATGASPAAFVIATDFEGTISVQDQIQQISIANLTSKTFIFAIAPA